MGTDTTNLDREPLKSNGHAKNSSEGFFGSPATTPTEYRLCEAGLARLRNLTLVDTMLAIEALTQSAHSNLRPDIENSADTRRSTTGPSPGDFRWLTNLDIYDFPSALQSLAKAADTAGYPDISYKLGTLAGDKMMYRHAVDIDPEAIRREIRRKSFSTHGANDLYVYDRSVVLFGELYRFCRGGYSTAVRHGKNEAAWQYGYDPGPEGV